MMQVYGDLRPQCPLDKPIKITQCKEASCNDETDRQLPGQDRRPAARAGKIMKTETH